MTDNKYFRYAVIGAALVVADHLSSGIMMAGTMLLARALAPAHARPPVRLTAGPDGASLMVVPSEGAAPVTAPSCVDLPGLAAAAAAATEPSSSTSKKAPSGAFFHGRTRTAGKAIRACRLTRSPAPPCRPG